MSLDEFLFITGKLLWRDEECYSYELHQLENCKNKLKLNQTYNVICDDEEKDVDVDDYELFNVFDNTFTNPHRQTARPPSVKVDREQICKVLKLEDSCK